MKDDAWSAVRQSGRTTLCHISANITDYTPAMLHLITVISLFRSLQDASKLIRGKLQRKRGVFVGEFDIVWDCIRLV